MEQQSAGEKRERLMTELPEEVIIDKILTRLPIESVVRFKSVSKSWLSLLSDSRFIKEHSILSPMQNPNDYDCFVAHKANEIATVSRHKETFVLPRNGFFFIGSVNGLVCLLHGYRRVSLWNPAMHQSMEFNLLQDGYSRPTLIGVGFDRVSNDYKVVVCHSLLNSCVVYSYISNSWIQLSVLDHKFRINKFEIFSNIPTTYVKDCPYWTYTIYSYMYSFGKSRLFTSPTFSSVGTHPSFKNNFVKSLAALKFDPTSNKFRLLPEFFPDARSRDREKVFRFVNMRDLLTLMEYELSSVGKLDIYSLDEEKECGVWIKMHHVGPFEQFSRFHFLQQGFKYNDEVVFFEFGKICYYDHRTYTFECLPGTVNSYLVNCFTHTLSMVLIQGMKSSYSENQTHPLGPPLRLITSLEEYTFAFDLV